MGRSTVAAIGGSLVGAVLAGTALTALRRPRRTRRGRGVSAFGDALVHLRLGDLRFLRVVPGAERAELSGDVRTGPYVAITRFDPGAEHAPHKHPNELHLFVISGAYLYRKDGQEIRVGPNEYLFIPAGEVHMSAGDPREGAVFLEHSSAPFDLIPVD
jgi:quercetin dioxygenase-like cupin family protein